MSQEPNNPRSHTWRIAFWSFVLLVVYPLSMGPAAWLVALIGPGFWGWHEWVYWTIYHPVQFAAQILGMEVLLRRYVDWFIS